MREAKNEKLAVIASSLNLIKKLGFSKRDGKVEVFSYILGTADDSFLIHKSLSQIANETGVDYGTVQSTFNILYDKKIIRPRAYCVYQIDYEKLVQNMSNGRRE